MSGRAGVSGHAGVGRLHAAGALGALGALVLALLAPAAVTASTPTAAAHGSAHAAAHPAAASIHPTAASTVLARAARALQARDTAHLHYVNSEGSLLYEEGRASGTLPASMKADFTVGSTMSGRFTIYTAAGTIVGHASAKLHGEGIYESFSGTLSATGGSGRYRHAHGTASMYGTFDRDNYAVVVRTAGTLYF